MVPLTRFRDGPSRSHLLGLLQSRSPPVLSTMDRKLQPSASASVYSILNVTC